MIEALTKLLKINHISENKFNTEKAILPKKVKSKDMSPFMAKSIPDVEPGTLAMRNIINEKGLIIDKNPWNSGTYGLVYKAFDNDGEEYTVKINKHPFDGADIKYTQEEWVDNTIFEMAYYYLFSKKGIGPKLPSINKAFYFQPDLGYIGLVTRKYKSDLSVLIRNGLANNEDTRKKIESSINNSIEIMLDLGLLCFDMKPGNVLVDWRVVDDKIILDDLVLTDFGRDWCCNARFYPKCDYLIHRDNFINTGNNKEYLKLLILFSFSVSAQYRNYKLFAKEMDILETLLDKQEFIQFINEVCERDSDCSNLRPPFHYLEGLMETKKIKMVSDHNENKVIQKIKSFIVYFKDKYS